MGAVRPRRKLFDVSKRAFDIVASSIALVLVSPVLGVTALLVRVKLGKPVIFRQMRPGRDGEIFELRKFRTMRNVDEHRGVVTNEQRMTSFGRKLRSLSLDELPSLWNILRGDMSVVGPRPLLVKYLSLYSPEQARRHDVRPGLTGLAQVSGRNALDWESRFKLDVHYVDRRSWRLDLVIILRTVLKVLQSDGINTDGYAVGAPFTGSPTKAASEDE